MHAARRLICGRGGTCSLQSLTVELMGTERGRRLESRHENLGILEGAGLGQGQRAPSAAQQPTDAMKRNVMGWPGKDEAWDGHQLTGCCDSSEAQDCSSLMTLTPRLAELAGRAGLVVSRTLAFKD